MSLRKYRNSAARTLSAPIANSTTTSMTVDSASGFPTQFPYTLIIDPDGTLEEVVDVTAAVGNVLTIVRGVDSTTASAHAAGVRVVHGVSARDFTEANVHVNQTSGAHGANGSLVDTDGVQTVVGQKTFTGGLKTTGGDVIDTATVQTVTGQKTFNSLKTSGGGDVVDVGSTQTISGNKTFSGTEVHNGTETHNGAATFSNLTATSRLVAPDAIFSTTYSGTTTDNPTPGFLTVTHGAGFTPSGAWAVTSNPSGSFAVFWGVDSITSTTLRLRFINGATAGGLANQPVAGRLFLVRP